MREIRFRAWDTLNRVMYANPFNGEIGGINDTFANAGNWIYMQYTGQKDESGSEIFEGDIVHAQHDIGETPYSQEILFRCGGFCIGGKDFICNLYNVKIVGNIFQNPERLRGNLK